MNNQDDIREHASVTGLALIAAVVFLAAMWVLGNIPMDITRGAQ